MPDGFYVIVNPTAGSGRAGRRSGGFVDGWRDGGAAVRVVHTTGPGHATRLATEAVDAGWGAVVAVGGDGTVHEVGQALLQSAGDAPTVALGIVPLGSGNDFARAVGLPADPDDAARALPSMTARSVDAGRVNDRFFLNGVGIGFDARVAVRARSIPFLRGTALYGLALLRELATWNGPAVTVHLDGREVARGTVTMITATNGPSHGGGFHLCPAAVVDDGVLDLLVADAMPRRGVLSFLVHALEGRHGADAGIHLATGRSVQVSAASPLPVHVDGEVVEDGWADLDIAILPGRLRVLA